MTDDPLVIVAAVLTGIMGTARLTRLVVDDTWPPVIWLKSQYTGRVSESWAPLLSCAACFAPWVALPNLAIAIATDLHPAWWFINGWLAVAYAATMIVWRDYPNGEND